MTGAEQEHRTDLSIEVHEELQERIRRLNSIVGEIRFACEADGVNPTVQRIARMIDNERWGR